MNDIDNRIVEMRFDNNQFEAGVSQTLKTLDQLKESLNFEGALQGIGTISSGIETLNSHFSVAGMIGMEAMQRISSAFVDATEKAIRFASGIDQIQAGFAKFGQKTTSVGTLVAQGFDLEEVNNQLDRLNWFTDETSYNFTDMVESIGKFTATGKGLTESVDAMEGIALWAAVSGQNAQKASHAMYQLSQALGAGYMRKEDYRSIQNLSMDTDEFRQIALETAVELGTLKKTGEDTYQSLEAKADAFTKAQFAEHLTKDAWFTSDVMMEVYKKYASATQDIYEYAEKNNITASQAIEAIGDQVDALGLKAFKAGQEARTFSDVLDAVADTVATSWMQSFTYIFGDYDEAVALWTDLVNRIIEVTDTFGSARNRILETWKLFSGRDMLINSYSNLFDGLGTAVGYAGEAFGKILRPLRDVDDIMKDARGYSKEGDEIIDSINRIRTAIKTGVISGEQGADQLEELYDQLYAFDDSSFLIRFSRNLEKATESFKSFFDAGRGSVEIEADIKRIKTAISTGALSEKDGTIKLEGLYAELDKVKISEANIDSFQNGIETIAKAVGLLKNIGTGVGTVIGVLFDNLSKLITPVSNLITSFLNLVDALLDVEDDAGLVKTSFESMADVIDGILGPSVKVFGDVLDWLSKKMDLVAGQLREKDNPLSQMFSGMVTAITEFANGVNKNAGPIQEAVNTISGWINTLATSLGGAGLSVANSLGVIFGTIFKDIAQLAQGFFDTSGLLQWKTIFKLLGDLTKAGILINITNGFTELLKTLKLIPEVLTAAKNAVEGVQKLLDSAQGVLGKVSKFLTGNKDAIGLLTDSPAVNVIITNFRNLSISMLMLAASLYIIGKIDSDKLLTIFTGVAMVLGELAAAVIVLDKALNESTTVKTKGIFGIFGKEVTGKTGKDTVGVVIGFAAAILILAAAMAVLGTIDSEKLLGSFIAMSAMLWELVGVCYALKKLNLEDGKITKGLIGLSVAVLILSKVAESLGKMDTEQLVAGVLGLGAIFFELGAFVKAIGDTKVLITTALAMVIFGAAMANFVESISVLGGMDTSALVQGIIGLGAVMLELYLFAQAMQDKSILLASVSITILSGALKKIADVVAELAAIDPMQLANGLGALAFSIIVVVTAMTVLGKQGLKSAASMILASVALSILAPALKSIVDTIGTLGGLGDSFFAGILGLAGVLTVLGIALSMFGKAAADIIVGSAAVMIASVALSLLVPPIRLLCGIKMDQVAPALLMLGGVLVELGVGLAAFGAAAGLILAGTGVLLAIGLAISGLAAIVLAIGVAFVDTLMKFADSSQKLVDAVNAISNVKADTFVDNMTAIAKGYEAFGSALGVVNFIFGPRQAEALVTISDAVSKIAPSLKNLSTGIEPTAIKDILVNLSEGFTALGTSVKAFPILFSKGRSQSMTEIAEGIAVLAPALKDISSISNIDIKATMENIADGFKALAGANRSFGLLSGIGADTISKISGAIVPLSDGLFKLKDIPAETISSVLEAIGNAFMNFGEAIQMTPILTKNRSEGIGNLVSSIDELADGLKKMSTVPSETVNRSLEKIGAAFKQFGVAISNTPLFSPKNRAEGIGIVVDSVAAFCDAIPKLVEAGKVEGLEEMVTKIGDCFTSLGSTLYSAPLFGAADRGEGIASMAESIEIFAEGIKRFHEIGASSEEIDGILTAISTAFKNFGEAIGATGLWAEGKASGISTVVDSTDILADAVKKLTDGSVDIDKFTSIMDGIGEAYKKFGVAISSTGLWAEGRGEGIANVVDTTGTLADAIVKLSEVPVVQAQHILQIIADGLTAVSDTINSTGLYAEQKAEGIASISNSIKDDLAPAIQSIATIDVAKMQNSIPGLVEAIGSIKTALADFTSNEYSGSMTNNVLTALNTFVDSIINYDFTAVKDFGKSLINSIIEGINEVKETLTEAFRLTGEESINKFIDGIKENSESVNTTTSEVLDESVKAAKEKESTFYDIGKNYMIGMANGITENSHFIVSAAQTAAASAAAAAQDALGEHSPSKVGHQIGAFFDIGIGNGISDFANVVELASKKMAKTIPSSMSEPLSSISDAINNDLDFSPSITPIIDLDGVSATAKTLGSMVDANNVEMTAASMSLNSQIDQMDDLVDKVSLILTAIQNGSDLYLDDSILAGRINRRLGAV